VSEQCEIDKAGEVTITNNTSESLWFDVTYQVDDEGISFTNENRVVAPGQSTTYTVSAGEIKIWGSYGEDEEFWLVSTQNLAQCSTIDFQTPSQSCDLFNIATVQMVNLTGDHAWVDIRQGYYLYGALFLEPNQTATYYYVWAGAPIEIGIRVPGIIDNWTWDVQSISACTSSSWDWTYSKAKSLFEKSQGVEKPATLKFQRPTKK
jgi:hypothetical protein